MKSAIAAFVSAVREYLENNEIKGTISLLITNDEEGPAINGTRKVLEEIYKNGEKIDSCLVGEPTCPSNLGEMIKIGRRGSITTTIKVSGNKVMLPIQNGLSTPVNPLTSILNTLCNLELDKGTEDFPPSNMEIVKIESSEGATNIVPQTSTGTFNIRYNINHTKESLQSMINEVISKISIIVNIKLMSLLIIQQSHF